MSSEKGKGKEEERSMQDGTMEHNALVHAINYLRDFTLSASPPSLRAAPLRRVRSVRKTEQ